MKRVVSPSFGQSAHEEDLRYLSHCLLPGTLLEIA
jgi:hypothetical protein